MPFPGAESYNVYCNGKKIASGVGNQYIDANVPIEVDLSYMVKAVFSDGSESEAGLTGTLEGLPPFEAPRNIKGRALRDESIDIRWDVVPRAILYDVYRSESGEEGSFELLHSVQEANITIRHESRNYRYYYQVKARDLAGRESPGSDLLEVQCSGVSFPNLGFRGSSMSAAMFAEIIRRVDREEWKQLPSKVHGTKVDICTPCHIWIWSAEVEKMFHSGTETTETFCLVCHNGSLAAEVSREHRLDWARLAVQGEFGDMVFQGLEGKPFKEITGVKNYVTGNFSSVSCWVCHNHPIDKSVAPFHLQKGFLEPFRTKVFGISEEAGQRASLSAELDFEEPSGNGALDALESGALVVRIKNKGGVKAESVSVSAHWEGQELPVQLPRVHSIKEIRPGARREVRLVISGKKELEDAEGRIRVEISEAGALEPTSLAVPFRTRALQSTQATDKTGSHAGNDFELELYRRLAVEKSGENIVLSPYSVLSSLSMFAQGLDVDAGVEMRTMLGADYNRSGRFNVQGAGQGEPADLDNADESGLAMVGSLFIDKRSAFSQAYDDLVSKVYGAGVLHTADFKNNPEDARIYINDLTGLESLGVLSDAVPEGSIDRSTELALVNWAYLKGSLSKSFFVKSTISGRFAMADGEEIETPLMWSDRLSSAGYASFNRDGSLFVSPRLKSDNAEWERRYPDLDGFSMVELDLLGDQLSLVMIAPNRFDGLPAIEKMLTAENLNRWLGGLEKRESYVIMPRLRVEATYALNDLLQSMGAVKAFQSSENLGVGHADSSLSLFQHQAFIEISEEGRGRRYANATWLDPVFNADRPFLFLVRDKEDGRILIIGRIMKPVAAAGNPVVSKADASHYTEPAAGKDFADPETGMEFVWIEGGCFTRGDPARETCVEGFWMSKYEATVGQYLGLANPDSDKRPVRNVSWLEASQYAKNHNYRLPTEAEWEYAVRDGTTTERYWGDDPDDVCKKENLADASQKTLWRNWLGRDCEDGHAAVAPVGSFKPNGFGLYDMLGNVSEWCQDWYDDDYYAESPRYNPGGPDKGGMRVVRGGSFHDAPQDVGSRKRYGFDPKARPSFVGFRLAKSRY